MAAFKSVALALALVLGTAAGEFQSLNPAIDPPPPTAPCCGPAAFARVADSSQRSAFPCAGRKLEADAYGSVRHV